MKLTLLLALVLLPAVNLLASIKKVPDIVVKADLLDIKDPTKTVFQFEKNSFKEGNKESVSRKFIEPDGKLIVEENLSYQDGEIQKIELNHIQLGETGSLLREGKKLKFSYSKNGKTKNAEENLDGTLVPADQIYGFLQKNWDKLRAGETIAIRLPVLDRLETVGFKFFKEKDVDIEGVKATVIKMKPSSFVIAAIVDPILFYFHPSEMVPEGRKCIQVVGRTVPKRKVGDKWKDLDVIMKFRY